MVALELRAGATFDPAGFDEFLRAQPDLGPKWVPAFVRTTGELPKLASMKVDKARGMNVSVVTTARTDEEARKLLQLMGMPFRTGQA